MEDQKERVESHATCGTGQLLVTQVAHLLLRFGPGLRTPSEAGAVELEIWVSFCSDELPEGASVVVNHGGRIPNA